VGLRGDPPQRVRSVFGRRSVVDAGRRLARAPHACRRGAGNAAPAARRLTMAALPPATPPACSDAHAASRQLSASSVLPALAVAAVYGAVMARWYPYRGVF